MTLDALDVAATVATSFLGLVVAGLGVIRLLRGRLERWVRGILEDELEPLRQQMEPNGGDSLADRVDQVSERAGTIITELQQMGHNVTVVEQAIDAQQVALSEHVRNHREREDDAETMG